MAQELWVVRCGTVPYASARDAQQALERARHAGDVPDLLLLLEHPPVYTRGRRSTADELPMGEGWYRTQGIDVTPTDRGGRVTYHGPGQLVGYPILSLAPYGDDVHLYVRSIERVMIEVLGSHGVEAQTIAELTGVWTAGPRPGDAEAFAAGEEPARKIGSIGVHVNRGITTHGFAINVSNDLQPFEWIVPCGIEGCRMTSVRRELGADRDLAAFGDAVAERFAAVYRRQQKDVAAAHLGELVEGVEALVGAGALCTPVR